MTPHDEAAEIWLCQCITPGEPMNDETFAFSSKEAAGKWADTDSDRVHVIYSRVIDHPEIADMVQQ